MGKKFVLTATVRPDGTFCIESENTGFDTLEILGILSAKEHDIHRQAEMPSEFVRKMITENGTTVIVDKEDEE